MLGVVVGGRDRFEVKQRGLPLNLHEHPAVLSVGLADRSALICNLAPFF